MNRITGNPVEINDLFNNRYKVQYYQENIIGVLNR